MGICVLSEDHGTAAGELIFAFAQSLKRPKQRRHEFWILTCYVDFDLIEKYVGRLLKHIRLTEVYLAFDFSEVYKNGPKATVEKLDGAVARLRSKDIDFQWRTLAGPRLVHSKGYALVQRVNGEASEGLVLTTSANFTTPGFEGENFEIGYSSLKKRDIGDFERLYNHLWDRLGVEVTPAIFRQEEYLLKFALLSSGLFLHKWAGNLRQHLGIKYELTPAAKARGSIAPELAAVGFEAGDTFTRQVLNLQDLPGKEIPSSFTKRFTIETYWGRWCPIDAWNTLSESFEGAAEFIQQFQYATADSALSDALNGALEVQKDLVAKGLIKPVRGDHLENWAARIRELRVNRRRLERFCMGYEAHGLPYKIEQKSDVQSLFEDLVEAIELSKATNIAKEKMRSAIKRRNPNLIQLTKEEIEIVRKMSRSN